MINMYGSEYVFLTTALLWGSLADVIHPYLQQEIFKIHNSVWSNTLPIILRTIYPFIMGIIINRLSIPLMKILNKDDVDIFSAILYGLIIAACLISSVLVIYSTYLIYNKWISVYISLLFLAALLGWIFEPNKD